MLLIRIMKCVVVLTRLVCKSWDWENSWPPEGWYSADQSGGQRYPSLFLPPMICSFTGTPPLLPSRHCNFHIFLNEEDTLWNTAPHHVEGHSIKKRNSTATVPKRNISHCNLALSNKQWRLYLFLQNGLLFVLSKFAIIFVEMFLTGIPPTSKYYQDITIYW